MRFKAAVCLSYDSKRQFFSTTSNPKTKTIVIYSYFTLKEEQRQQLLIFGMHDRDPGLTRSYIGQVVSLPVRLSFAPSIISSTPSSYKRSHSKKTKKGIPNYCLRSSRKVVVALQNTGLKNCEK